MSRKGSIENPFTEKDGSCPVQPGDLFLSFFNYYYIAIKYGESDDEATTGVEEPGGCTFHCLGRNLNENEIKIRINKFIDEYPVIKKRLESKRNLKTIRSVLSLDESCSEEEVIEKIEKLVELSNIVRLVSEEIS